MSCAVMGLKNEWLEKGFDTLVWMTRVRVNLLTLSSAVPELWFCSSGGVCVRMRVCSEPLYL